MVARRKLTDAERPRCSEPGCECAAVKRGMCEQDYRAHLMAGTLPTTWLSLSGGRLHEAGSPRVTVMCSDPGCDRVGRRLGMCDMHYQRDRCERKRLARQQQGKPSMRDALEFYDAPASLEEQLDEMDRRSSWGPDPPWVRHPQPMD